MCSRKRFTEVTDFAPKQQISLPVARSCGMREDTDLEATCGEEGNALFRTAAVHDNPEAR